MAEKDATLAELEAEFRTLAEQVDVASARRQELEVLIRARKADVSARTKLYAMSSDEVDALKRVIDERDGKQEVKQDGNAKADPV